jgi:hypothetical protein
LLLADALIRLAPQQRSSRPQDRSFVRSALLSRLQQKTAWTAQPIVQAAPHDREDEEGDLEDGTWLWRLQGFTTVEDEAGKRGILHVWLKNDLDEVGVGQPVAVVLCDADHSYAWSPVASSQVAADTCPAGCRGSLASIAVEPKSEILGHLSFPLSADAAPNAWGLQMGHHGHMRPLKS